MSDSHAIDDDRPLGTRYRLEQPDGTWWEVGWDRPLGTFYAQHYSPEPYDPFTPDQPLAWHGTRPSELTTVVALSGRTNVRIPDAISDELRRDAEAHPHTVDPPFLQLAAEVAGLTELDHPGRTTLPAAPVADALNGLRRDPYLAADDITAFARGLGIDADLARDIADGAVDDLNVEQIAHVCEALRCSPYDLWGPRLGREILDVYGPDSWPRYIEPLDDARSLGIDDSFIRRRVEQQAAQVVQVADSAPTQVPLEVTRFRQTAVLAVDADGGVERVTDTLQPADRSREYHFAFQRTGEVESVAAPLTPDEFAAGCPAGHDATPALVDLANRLEATRPGADMFRFRDPGTDAEQWLGRDTPFDPWQTWDDPRLYYPGDPSDVLDERMVDLTPPLPFDVRSAEAEAELEGAGLDF